FRLIMGCFFTVFLLFVFFSKPQQQQWRVPHIHTHTHVHTNTHTHARTHAHTHTHTHTHTHVHTHTYFSWVVTSKSKHFSISKAMSLLVWLQQLKQPYLAFKWHTK